MIHGVGRTSRRKAADPMVSSVGETSKVSLERRPRMRTTS
jgi:hypothetical protein